ncbi:hypothetical protein ACQ4PT_023675 [Festuca glaucescens]
MILVDGAGGEWPVIGHAPWNGCNLADFAMPFFLFIVGMAIPLSLKVRFTSFPQSVQCTPRIPDRGRAVRRVVMRTLKLLFWGILLQGGYSHAPDDLAYGVDMKYIRWCGILQRIAFAYLVVAVIEIATKDARVQDQSSSGFSIFRLYLSQWIVACCILLIYLSLVYGIYVPDWEFRVRNVDSPNYGKVLTVTCGTRGNTSPPCNAVGYIDRKVLGINHLYQKPAWRRHWLIFCGVEYGHRGTLWACARSYEESHGPAKAVAGRGHSSACSWNHPALFTCNSSEQTTVLIQLHLRDCGCCWHRVLYTVLTSRRRESWVPLGAAAVDRDERDAGVRDGGRRHLRGLPQRLVLRRDQQHTGLLGEEARVRGGVALDQGGHPPLRTRRADPALGARRRPLPPCRDLLEALAIEER